MTDKYHGQGGSYQIDPKTGEKTLIHRTEEQPDTLALADKPAVKKTKANGEKS